LSVNLGPELEARVKTYTHTKN